MLDAIRISSGALDSVPTHNIYWLLGADHQYGLDKKPYTFPLIFLQT